MLAQTQCMETAQEVQALRSKPFVNISPQGASPQENTTEGGKQVLVIEPNKTPGLHELRMQRLIQEDLLGSSQLITLPPPCLENEQEAHGRVTGI